MISSLSNPLQNDIDTIVIDILSRYSLDNKIVKRFVESVAQQVRDINGSGRLKQKNTDSKESQNNSSVDNSNTVKSKPGVLTRLENFQTAFNKGGLLGIFFEYLKNKQTQDVAKIKATDQTSNLSTNLKDNTTPPIAQTIKTEKNINNVINNKTLENKTNTLERVINNLQKVQETFSKEGLLGISKNVINYFKGSNTSQAVPFTTRANNSVINNTNTTNVNNDKSIAVTKNETQAQKQDLLKEEQTVVLGGINDKGASDLEAIILNVFKRMVPEQKKGIAAKEESGSTDSRSSQADGSLWDLFTDLAAGGLLAKAAFGKKGIIRAPLRQAKAARLKEARAAKAATKAAIPPATTSQAAKQVTTKTATPKPPASVVKSSTKGMTQAAGTSVTKGFGKAAAKRIPILGTLLTGALLASELGDVSQSEETGEITKEQAQTERGEAIGGAGGGLVGALGGAAAGAAIGSVVPIVGTAIGGIVGGIAGGFGGEFLGRKAGEGLVASQQTTSPEPLKAETTASVYEPKDLSPEEVKKWTESTKNAIKTETATPSQFNKNTAKLAPAMSITPETIKAVSSMPPSVTETQITNNNMDSKVLGDIAHNTEKTNKTLLSLSESIFKLAKNINTGGQSNNTVLVNNGQQTQAYTSTAQIAANNVDSIRLVRQQFLAATT